jgi:cytidylate kinase
VKKIIIAIDGYSSCGKSTLAQDLAKELSYIYIDTGAMYRAVTYYFLEHDIDINSIEDIASALQNINISFERHNQINTTFLNNKNVEKLIREMRINDFVSEVAAIPAVRKAMVKQQQEMGMLKGLVMDGRDIGTVVFPKAELKIFLTATLDVRGRRRQLEYQLNGLNLSLEEVMENLSHRDHIDSTRADSPLKMAEDAILIDNTNIDRSQQLKIALHLAKKLINE